jgi:hypothetical protein
MKAVSRERVQPEDEEFWDYLATLTAMLSDGGMSDEEPSSDTVTNEHGVYVNAMKVRRSRWRNNYFRPLYIAADAIPNLETYIFKMLGQPKMPRVRVDDVSWRPPPKHRLPRSFFEPGYLANLRPSEVEKVVSPTDFRLRSWRREGSRFWLTD